MAICARGLVERPGLFADDVAAAGREQWTPVSTHVAFTIPETPRNQSSTEE
jgi:hypothetical protein